MEKIIITDHNIGTSPANNLRFLLDLNFLNDIKAGFIPTHIPHDDKPNRKITLGPQKS